MKATNRQMRQASRQVFASDHSVVTDFYNRAASKSELREMFEDPAALRGTAVLIASPFGTGKTFFIDTAGHELGIVSQGAALRVPWLVESDLERAPGRVLFLDEADAKATWAKLDGALHMIGEHLAASGRTALLLGDYTLRNPALLAHLASHRFIDSFEPLDRQFLQGAVRQRLAASFGGARKQRVDDVIDPELYDVLVPDGLARVNSFRTIFAFLERLARELPHDGAPCAISLEMARRRADAEFDVFGMSPDQERFFFIFVAHLAEQYPRGSGLEDGLDRETMAELGRDAGYTTWETLWDEIIEPFCENGLILSRGIPGPDEDGEFIRYAEPFFPSLLLMLLASE